MKDSEIMMKAAARIRNGWTQGALFRSQDNSVCAVGAVKIVATDIHCPLCCGLETLQSWSPQEDRIINYVGSLCAPTPPHIMARKLIAWNDNPSATQERMASLFELAADLRRVEELSEDLDNEMKETKREEIGC